MLNCHPEIAIPHEFPLIEFVFSKLGNSELASSDVDKLCNGLFAEPHFRDWNLDHSIVESGLSKICPANVPQVVDCIYSLYSQSVDKKGKRWGEKNIGSASFVSKIFEWFPDVRFVHLVRDGRDVASSLLKRKWRFYRFPGRKQHYINHMIGAARTWQEGITLIRSQLAAVPDENKLEIYYEELIQNPDSKCREVCNFLDIQFDSLMLDYHQKNSSQKMIPESRITGTHENTTKPVLNSNFGKFRDDLSTRQIALFEEIAGKELEDAGYSLEGEKPKLLEKFGSQLSYWTSFVAFRILMTIRGLTKRISAN